MSSLEPTLNQLDEFVDRGAFVAPTIDPSKTVLLVLDMQKLIVDPQGAGYVQSVGGAPEGKDTVEPVVRVIEACRDRGIQVVYSLWGLRPDGLDKGICAPKWPALEPGTPQSPASWGNRDAEFDDAIKPREDEPVMYKHRFSSFYHTPLDEYMRELGADTLVIAGVTSANCAHATAIDGWNMNYKIVVLADTTTAVPASNENQPLGYGQHWEALRNIQMNYGDVLLSSEFFEKLGGATNGAQPGFAGTTQGQPAATQTSAY
jgi:ureidoacrylate peracid hydrolase